MVSFVNFAMIASLCVGFHLGTLHGYVFHQDFWPNLNFQLEYQIKLVLSVFVLDNNSAVCSNQISWLVKNDCKYKKEAISPAGFEPSGVRLPGQAKHDRVEQFKHHM